MKFYTLNLTIFLFFNAFIGISQVIFTSDDTRFNTGQPNKIRNGSFEHFTNIVSGCGVTSYFYVTPNRDGGGYATVDSGWVATGHSLSFGGEQYSHSYAYGRVNFNTASALPHGVRSFYFGNANTSITSGGPPNIDALGKISASWSPTFSTAYTSDPYDCAGTTVSFTNNPTTPVTLTYTATNLIVGHIYHLEYWVAGEHPTNYAKIGAFEFSMSGAASWSGWLPVHSAMDQSWSSTTNGSAGLGTSQRYHFEFTASATSLTITWKNYGHLIFNSAISDELVLDDVVLTDKAIPLPVVLSSFNANCVYDKVSLDWSVEEEINTSRYEILHSTTGDDFAPIAQQRASNSHQYNIIHAQPSRGINYYRLRMIDFDGTTTCSDIISVIYHSENKTRIYPLPASNELKLDLPRIMIGQRVEVEMIDQHGKKVLDKHIINAQDTESLSIASLISGWYSMRMTMDNEVLVFRVQVVK